MTENYSSIEPEFYYGEHLKLRDAIAEVRAKRKYAASRARFYGKLDDTPYRNPSSDAFRFEKMRDKAIADMIHLVRAQNDNLWRAHRDYQMNKEAYQSQALAESQAEINLWSD